MQFITLACVAICGVIIAALAPTSVPSQHVDTSPVRVFEPAELSLQLSAFLKYRTVGATSAPRHVEPEATQDFKLAMQFLEDTYDAAFRFAVVNKVCMQLYVPSTGQGHRSRYLHSYDTPSMIGT